MRRRISRQFLRDLDELDTVDLTARGLRMKCWHRNCPTPPKFLVGWHEDDGNGQVPRRRSVCEAHAGIWARVLGLRDPQADVESSGRSA